MRFNSFDVYSELYRNVRQAFRENISHRVLLYLALAVDWQWAVAEMMMNVICHWRTKFPTFAFGFSRVAPGSYFESQGRVSGCA